MGARNRFHGFSEAVSKPKLLSRYSTSLAIVFGIPMTLFRTSALNLSRYGRSALESAIPSDREQNVHS